MADFENEDDFDQYPDGDGPSKEAFEAELQRQIAELPPGFYDSMQPMLLLCGLANFRLMSREDDPVPRALTALLGYSLADVQEIHAVQDVTGLARLMVRRSFQLFDFLLIGRLVFEGPLGETICHDLRRESPGHDASPDVEVLMPQRYVLEATEGMLENTGRYLTGDDAGLREDLRMRRLQTESIFARLQDTLRLFYLPGQSPEERNADFLDLTDEIEDAEDPAVYIAFNAAQRLTLTTALQLPTILIGLGETDFGRALVGVRRFREKALQRLADRLATTETDEQFPLAWSEMLRLYQAAQVCALSTVADVLAVGSLEDVMLRRTEPDSEEEETVAALQPDDVRHTRELMTVIMAGFVEVIEENHPDEPDVIEAKEEISRLAALLV